MTYVIQEQVDCKSAKEFLEVLSPLSDYFNDKNKRETWLFRGQGRDLSLIPSLFRKNGKLKYFTSRDITNFSEVRLAERDILIQFFHIADKRGLILPDDSQELRSFFELLKDNDQMVREGFGGYSVVTKGLSIMTLAQHYGVPTRLLDWSRQAYIAAFFAAEDAYKNKDELPSNEKMVVWSFYFPAFDKQTRYGDTSYLLRGVTAPSATNINLRAQQGVFTLLDPHYTKEHTGTYTPIDMVLEQEVSKIVSSNPDQKSWLLQCEMRKFTLPTIEAISLLNLLEKLDITTSSIYPSYQSIASDMKMRKLWE